MATFDLLSADQLGSALPQGELVVIDARPADRYWHRHIAQARHLDPALLALARTDQAALTRFHALLTWALSTLGVSAASRVVVAGQQNEPNASRVAWALAYAGVAHVSLLDGGIDAWHGALTDAPPTLTPAPFALQPQTRYLATADDVLAAIRDGGAPIIDARERDEYSGQRSNAGRKGRIPGARFWDTRLELNEAGRFAAPHALSEPLARWGAPQTPAIVYCGGGGRAARTFIAAQLAGHRHTAVYPASWNEWGTHEQYPVQAPDA